MKVFIASLGTETNTFSPLPTGWATFEDTMLFHGDATQHEPMLFSEPLHVWRKMAEAQGWEVVESVAAFAQPAGICVRAVYDALLGELLRDLEAAMPVDIALINMHGAMVADGCLDCEGDILSKVRAVVGPDRVVGGELDLHCSVTGQMLEAADALITFKEYPHIDAPLRAEELFRLCADTAAGKVRPVMARYDCRMINTWRTPFEPTRSFVDKLQSLEGKDGILSISFAHGFPWGDVPEASAKILVVADGDEAKAAALAKTLGQEVWAMREATSMPPRDMNDVLEEAAGHNSGPVVIADTSDNAGGGAPSDATFLLSAALDKGMTGIASGIYWDPTAVRFCEEAGEGANLELRIGGKVGKASGLPLDLNVTVKKIIHNAQQTFGTSMNLLGTAVWLQMEGDIDLILNTNRTQVFHPDCFTQFGIDLAAKKIVFVKSSQHFYAGFNPIAESVLYCATPGAIAPHYGAIPFKVFTDPYWPKVEDPFAV
jgi:microcystin degradation protein MlrC